MYIGNGGIGVAMVPNAGARKGGRVGKFWSHALIGKIYIILRIPRGNSTDAKNSNRMDGRDVEPYDWLHEGQPWV